MPRGVQCALFLHSLSAMPAVLRLVLSLCLICLPFAAPAQTTLRNEQLQAQLLARTGRKPASGDGHRGPVSGFGQVVRQLRAAQDPPPGRGPILDGRAEEIGHSDFRVEMPISLSYPSFGFPCWKGQRT